MSTRTTALALSRLADESAAWTLLRATSAPVAIAILEEHLGGDQRRIPAPDLIEMMEIDLDDLRDQGFDLPRRAQAYCAEWRSAGFLVLRPTDETRTETYELSPAALSAIRYIRQLAEPRATVTQSRLATIASRLEDLARDSDPEVTSRLAALRSQRDRIDAEITRISVGDVPAVDPESAAERARDIVDLARGLPDDFAQVRADLELLNRNLRARIVEDDKTQGHVLDEIFRGVDILGESDAGRSFAAFYALVLDAEVSGAFEDSIDDILGRPFAAQLTSPQRTFLRSLLPTLQERSSEIHGVMTTFARGLRRFVVSQEYQQDREVRRLLRSSLSEAAALVPKIKPYASVGYDLTLTSVSLQSIGALSLNNPADLESTGPLIDHADDVVDLETLRALARATEIDMVELTANVNAAVDEIGTCTIGDILLRTPATQGVASVVGLMVLADRHASALDGGELVSWPRRSDETGPREGSNDQITLGTTDSAPEISVTAAAPASRFARVPHAVFTRRIA